MQDVLSILSQMRRPKLLMRAARIGADEYRRERHLPRILGITGLPRSGEALLRLIEIEETQNTTRVTHEGNYNMARHVEILIAMVAEARLLQQRGATRPAAPESTVVRLPIR